MTKCNNCGRGLPEDKFVYGESHALYCCMLCQLVKGDCNVEDKEAFSLLNLIHSYGTAVMNSTKAVARGNITGIHAKREVAAAKRLVKKLLGETPSSVVEWLIPG